MMVGAVSAIVAHVALIIQALIGTWKGKELLGKQMPAGFLEMVKNMILMNEPEYYQTAQQGVSYEVTKIGIVGLVNDTDKGTVRHHSNDMFNVITKYSEIWCPLKQNLPNIREKGTELRMNHNQVFMSGDLGG